MLRSAFMAEGRSFLLSIRLLQSSRNVLEIGTIPLIFCKETCFVALFVFVLHSIKPIRVALI